MMDVVNGLTSFVVIALFGFAAGSAFSFHKGSSSIEKQAINLGHGERYIDDQGVEVFRWKPKE